MTEALMDMLVSEMLIVLKVVAVVLEEADCSPDIHSLIPIYGVPTRCLYVGTTQAAALKLLGPITGLTPDVILTDPALLQDVVAEVANILAGNLWPLLDGATGIGLPSGGDPPRPLGEPMPRVYAIDGVPALVVLIGSSTL